MSMTVTTLTSSMQRLAVVLSACVVALTGSAWAQTPQDRIDPLSTDTVLLRPFATMTGTMTNCKPRAAESFGRIISALGDLDKDGIADFGVNRYRCDTVFDDFGVISYPDELLIYHGVKGGLPSALDGQRVGPSEIGSSTTFLAAGDWDGDGHKDLAVRIHLFADSSQGDSQGSGKGYVVIFWGTISGRYSIGDTTHISCGGPNWLRSYQATSADFNGDGVEDLAIWGGSYLSQGKFYQTPILMMFQGHDHQRWGQDGISWLFDLGWWSFPSFGSIQVVDQDCDGSIDLALYGIGIVSVIYGRKGALPDTTSVQSIDLTPSPVLGSHPLLSDVTGDHVPELILNCADERIRIYAGKPGQRLRDLFGSGNDPADPDHGRPYPRPWNTLDLPHRLHDGWSAAVGSPIYDFGDMNLDGYRDIWTYSAPFIICYGSEQYVDSKIDAMFDTRDGSGFRSLAWLGDIDGSGYQSFAVSDGTVPGTIQFVKPTKQWEVPADVMVPFPHPKGFVCTSGAGVASTGDERSSKLRLTATPNPSGHDVTIAWSTAVGAGSAEITVSDVSGRVIDRMVPTEGTRSAQWTPEGDARGEYFVTVRIGGATSTVRVVFD